MKKLLFLIFFLLLIVFSTPTYATLIYPTSSKGTPRISKQYVMPEIKVEKVNGYDYIVMPGLDDLSITGEPILPFKTVRLLLPLDQEFESVEIIPEQKTYFGNYNISFEKQPVPLSWSSSEIVREQFANLTKSERNETIYSSSEEYPGKLYSIISTQIFRGYKILILNIFPVQYIPKTGEVYYFKKINVNIYTKSIPSYNIKLKNTFRGLDSDKAELSMRVDNYEEVTTYKSSYPMESMITGASIVEADLGFKYVIITNSEFAPAFEVLASWKFSQGIKTYVMRVEDIYSHYSGIDNQEKIRNFIKDIYSRWHTEYILLGGDGDGSDVGGESGDNVIPVRYLQYDPADIYYSNLDGTFNYVNDGIYGRPGDGCDINADCEVDLYSEVYIGRAPVDSVQEVNNFVDKTIAYESSNNPYLRNALMVGEYLGFGEPSEYGDNSKEEIRRGSSEHGYITEGIYKGYNIDFLYESFNPWNNEDIIPKINNGVHIINHFGHGSNLWVMKLCNNPFSESDIYCDRTGLTHVDDLTNTNYPFIYSQACYAGAFDNKNYEGRYTMSDSIAEHFVTSAHGAFAVIMNSRYGWGKWNSTDGASQRYDRQFFDAIFGEGITELGKANQDSKEDNIGSINTKLFMRSCYFELNLLGDPTVKLKIDYSAPQAEITSSKLNDDVAGTIEIRGTAKEGRNPGSTFQKYEIYYGSGLNPTQWFSNAIMLVNNGQNPISDGLLATFDTTTIDNGIYTIKLVVTDNMGVTTESKTVRYECNGGSIECDGKKSDTVWCDGNMKKTCNLICQYSEICDESTECSGWRPNTGCCSNCFNADINDDYKVNILDSIQLASAFRSKPGDPNWNPSADINKDNRVNILDAIGVSSRFGVSCE